jgi:hypothetical protein
MRESIRERFTDALLNWWDCDEGRTRHTREGVIFWAGHIPLLIEDNVLLMHDIDPLEIFDEMVTRANLFNVGMSEEDKTNFHDFIRMRVTRGEALLHLSTLLEIVRKNGMRQ